MRFDLKCCDKKIFRKGPEIIHAEAYEKNITNQKKMQDKCKIHTHLRESTEIHNTTAIHKQL